MLRTAQDIFALDKAFFVIEGHPLIFANAKFANAEFTNSESDNSKSANAENEAFRFVLFRAPEASAFVPYRRRSR